MSTSLNNSFTIDTVSFKENQIILLLKNGTELCQPLRYLLKEATQEQLADWTFNSEHSAVLWPHLGKKGMEIAACDVAWEMICEHALGKLKQADWKLDSLGSLAEREVVALWRLEADGYNGGFLQFFCNWGNDNCLLALQALETIGALATLSVVRQQRSVLDRLENHPELKAYSDIYKLLTPEESTLIVDELDQQLWDAAEEIPGLGATHYFSLLSS